MACRSENQDLSLEVMSSGRNCHKTMEQWKDQGLAGVKVGRGEKAEHRGSSDSENALHDNDRYISLYFHSNL